MFVLWLKREAKIEARSHLWRPNIPGLTDWWKHTLSPQDRWPFWQQQLGRFARLPQRAEGAIFSAPELAQVITEVNDLAFEIAEDEHGRVRPSYYALKHCLRLLLALARTEQLPRPTEIGTDGNGAIRISWMAGDREVELVCPSEEEERPYVYYSSTADYGTKDEVSSEQLLEQIHWAISAP